MALIETCIAENYQKIRQRISIACDRVERSESTVGLVAITKYAELEWVRALTSVGLNDLGESRPQQLAERAELLSETVHWHLIGHLQRNKIRKVLPLITLIHSVDTIRLLMSIERVAEELDLRPRVLLEVNVSGESDKDGFRPSQLVEGWPSILSCQRVQVDGLMTMAPHSADPEDARPVFRQLFELRERLRSMSADKFQLPHLSMGMSGDFEIAIEEGATLIRIGRSLFAGL